MIFEQSNTVINDIWRAVLIVKSDTPINLSNDNVIVDTNDYYETTYYTDGLFRTFEENGKYINWYLINSKTVKEREVTKVKAELEQAKLNNLSLAQAVLELQYQIDVKELGGTI